VEPSTLPPPPFESEVEVPGLEWWLSAHLDIASELLWLDSLLDAVPEPDPHVDTVRGLAGQTAGVRDALYELYCDAADERLAPLTGEGGALEARVRVCYAWCMRVAGLLAGITSRLRAPGGMEPDWAEAKAEFRHAEALDVARSSELRGLRDAVRALPIDFSSPVEPLRNLPRDLEQLFAALDAAQKALAARFG
jgi:hypothetical protein